MRAAFATFIVIVAGLLAVAAASGQSLDSPLAPSVGFGARAVAAHASSVIAMADIANSWRFHGRCTEGMPMLRQAIRIISGGGDPLLVYPLPDSYGNALQEMATRCERESR